MTCIATPSDGATGEVTWTAGDLTAEGDTATFLFEEGGVVTVSACATFSDCGDEAICGSMDLALTDLSSVRPGDADEDHVPTGCGACAGARSRPSGPLLTMVLVGALAALRRPYRSFTSS